MSDLPILMLSTLAQFITTHVVENVNTKQWSVRNIHRTSSTRMCQMVHFETGSEHPQIAETVVNLISSSFHHEKFLLVIAISFRMI